MFCLQIHARAECTTNEKFCILHEAAGDNVALITNSPSGKPALVRCHAISRYHQATEMSDDIRALLHLYLCSLPQNKNQRPENQRPTSEKPS